MSKPRLPERLLTWHELEPWMRDNGYILTGYRHASASYRKSIRSILQIHNETGLFASHPAHSTSPTPHKLTYHQANIWSHLLGALLFTAYLIRFTTTSLPTIQSLPATSDILAISIYYLAVINCFALSTSFHTLSNHSKPVHKFGNELDHLGIVLVIYGSAVPATYFQFYCARNTATRNAYWSLSTAFAAASAFFTLQPRFRQPVYRRVRFGMYTLLGLSCFIPIVHGLYTTGYEELERKMAVSHFFGLGVVQFTGAAIYAARVPERWLPERFDLVGNSHQIMHVMVVFGALVFERGLLGALARWNDGVNSCHI